MKAVNLKTLFFALVFVTFTVVSAKLSLSSTTNDFFISEVQVSGNLRIDGNSVKSYLGVQDNSLTDFQKINDGIKNLYRTGFFSNVKIAKKGPALIVNVQENPTVSEVIIEGNESIDNDDLLAEISIRTRDIYNKVKVRNDISRLKQIYQAKGRQFVKINAQKRLNENNKVDVRYLIEEGPISKIQKISFIGNHYYSSNELLEVIESSEDNYFDFLNLFSSSRYDQDRLEFDKELLKRFYKERGFVDFKIKSTTVELTPNGNGFYIVFVLEEGNRYRLRKINVVSELKNVSISNFSDAIINDSDDLYNDKEIQKSIDNMVDILGNIGYAFVDIDPVVSKVSGKDEVDLTFKIEEGPRVYIEQINITGNVRTLDEVIRREFRLAEGDPYSSSRLRRTKERLGNLNFFKKVNMRNNRGSSPDKMIVDVNVEEKSTGEISFGAGFSSTDGPLADFGITERNFLGRGQQLRLKTTLSNKRNSYNVGFSEPYLFDREISGGVDLYRIDNNLKDESSFSEETVGFGLNTGYSLLEHLRHNLRYSLKQTDIRDVSANASIFIQEQKGEYVTSVIGHSLVYDKRDSAIKPTSGYFIRAGNNLAGLGGDSKYLSFEAESAYYYSIAPQWILKLYGSTGHLIGYGGKDIRINERYFVGARKIRGFDNAGIGPRDLITRDALGGNTYYAGTLELAFPLGLPDDLGVEGAVFVDFANLFDADNSSPRVLDKNSTRISVGPGITWSSPFGPVRLDFGFPLIKESYDKEKIFKLNFGTRF